MNQQQATEILYMALAEPIGLLLAVEGDPEKARQALYRARGSAADPALAGLQFRMSPLEGGQLVITHGAPAGSDVTLGL